MRDWWGRPNFCCFFGVTINGTSFQMQLSKRRGDALMRGSLLDLVEVVIGRRRRRAEVSQLYLVEVMIGLRKRKSDAIIEVS